MVLRFFLFVGALLFVSCTDVERDSPYDPESKYYIGLSSSSMPGSSSASVKNYCVYAEIGQCYFGLYSACPGVGGELADSCPYGSSSSAVVSSSSLWVGGSSSSQAVQSSSSEALPEYDYCVFISDRICLAGPMSICPPGGTLSNSCPYGSSSSAVAVSSSSAYIPISSSSAVAQSSSSSNVPSSSSVVPSSSSVITYTLACANVPSSGTAGTAITPPAVTCNGVAVSSGLAWTGAPNWSTPVAGTYSSISISASSGNCAGKTATCNGTLTVSASTPISSSSGIVSGSPVTYEGETYQTVVIGNQTWFKRNLNYNASDSKCGNGSILSDANTSTCDTYGRLYNWATAMGLPSNCNSSSCFSQIGARHRGICPVGWHIPSDAEWTTLTNYVGSSAGKKLKATSGWNENGNGTDSYGFAALPGGYGYSDGNFLNVGNYGSWWSASEGNSDDAYYRSLLYYYEYVGYNYYNKGFLFSVRCLQD